MQDKTKQKKARKEIKIHDLKPQKDAKGGGPGGAGSHGGLVTYGGNTGNISNVIA
jgi:hypothetical protein